MPSGFPQYPSNWHSMSPTDKISWVKNLSSPTAKNVAENNAWLKDMASRFGDKGAKAGSAVKAAVASKAGFAALGPLVSIGAPLAAGALGALAIGNAKKKFDKEIDTYTAESNNRHAELMKAIKKQRDNKLK